MHFTKFYFGTITAVYQPSNPLNKRKYQTEYNVLVTCDNYSQIPMRCIRNDPQCGSFNDFEDLTLKIGYRVLVLCPLGDQSLGIIMGGTRMFGVPQSDETNHWLRRYNEVEQFVDAAGQWGIRSRTVSTGPITNHIEVSKEKVRLGDDGSLGDAEDYIEIDRTNHNININVRNNWNITVNGNVNLISSNKVSITCSDIEATVSGSAKINAQTVQATIAGDATIEALGTIKIQSPNIGLNPDLAGAGVLTMATQPACFVTGLPFKGSLTVLAGE